MSIIKKIALMKEEHRAEIPGALAQARVERTLYGDQTTCQHAQRG